DPNCFLYLATCDNTKDLVIMKFTQQYCPQLHAFCTDLGHTPQLLGYGNIPGGWHIMVMDFTLKHLPRWSKDLKSVVKVFHDNGWVHGNLCNANPIVSNQEPERAMLVGFDWGGNVDTGPVYYPMALTNKDLMKLRPGGSQITKEHDDHTLASM
ncbi:hypothetical protein EDB89DRAFT_1856900, partial [Lactarius sanguifluus]